MIHERKPDTDNDDVLPFYESAALTLKEVLELTEQGNDLLRSARAILLGQPDPSLKEANE